MSALTPEAVARIAGIRLAVFDVDGVLTDGRLYYGPDGEELKVFNTLDGHGMKMLAESGVALAIVSGRSSKALERRARDLGIVHVRMGVADKARVYRALLDDLGIEPGMVAAIGDDVVDLPILRHCGFSAAVPAAPLCVREHVDYVTAAPGGGGAVREFCECLMRYQGTLDRALAKYLES